MHTFIEGGWDKVGLVEELGGMPAPRLCSGPCEHVLGANPPSGCTPAAPVSPQIFYHLGTEEQKVGRARR